MGRLGVFAGEVEGNFLGVEEPRLADSPVRRTPAGGLGEVAAFFLGAPLTIHCKKTIEEKEEKVRRVRWERSNKIEGRKKRKR